MKILIVDDEKLICEWLEFCIGKNESYEIVGVANNGQQALEIFSEKQPDIVLTDIRMPIMDGLELLRNIKSRNPEVTVILLTAFSEFDYVRKAMREGADEYILKTEINNATLDELLKRVSSQVKGNKIQNDVQYSGTRQHIIRKNLLKKDMLSESDIEELEKYGIYWEADNLFALALYKHQLEKDFILPLHYNIKNVVGIDYDQYVYVIIGNIITSKSSLNNTYIQQEYANTVLYQNNCMVGVSSVVNEKISTPRIIKEAVKSLAVGFYDEKLRVYHPLHHDEVENDKDWHLEFKKYYQRVYETKGLNQFNELKSIMDFLKENTILELSNIKEFSKNCLDLMYMRYLNDNTDISRSFFLEIKNQVDEAIAFSQIYQMLMGYAKKCIEINGFNDKELSHNVYKAVCFIRQHYNKSISLDQIADQVNLNSEYLSRLFKEETGQNYTTFVTNLRMQKAEVLLTNTTDKVRDIAEAVGYFNVSYFSTIFKKEYGVNPYEFRKKCKKVEWKFTEYD